MVDLVEAALLDTLKKDEVLRKYVRQFEMLPSLDEPDLVPIIKNFPSVGVMAASGKLDLSMNAAVMDDTGIYCVLCFTQNLRSRSAAFTRGVPGEKGVWEVVMDALRAAMRSRSLDHDMVTGVLPHRRVLLWASGKWTAASLELLISYRMSF